MKSETSVTNSRQHKKKATVWRRRHCSNCGAYFTTYERPSQVELLVESGGIDIPFNRGVLIVSIYKALSHRPNEAAADAYWLAETVEDRLYGSGLTLTQDDIAAVTYSILKKYDEIAALQYGAHHKLIASVRKRGRPSLSSRDLPNRP